MNLFNARIQRNPRVTGKTKRYVGLNFALLKSRYVSESEMNYGLSLMADFLDDLRAINARRNSKELKELNPLFEAAVEEKLAYTPEEQKAKIVIDFTRALKFGGMKE